MVDSFNLRGRAFLGWFFVEDGGYGFSVFPDQSGDAVVEPEKDGEEREEDDDDHGDVVLLQRLFDFATHQTEMDVALGLELVEAIHGVRDCKR